MNILQKVIIPLCISALCIQVTAIGANRSEEIYAPYKMNLSDEGLANISVSMGSRSLTRAEQYGYYTDNDGEMAYIVHLLNSLELEDDGQTVYANDVDYIYVDVNYDDEHTDRIECSAGRITRDSKQYNIVHYQDFRRLLELVKALKNEKINFDNGITAATSEWAKSYVDAAKESGLLPVRNQINYIGDIPRVEVCQLIDNLLKSEGIPQEDTTECPFEDTEDIAVSNLYDLGIINGKSETEFAPYDFVTREELAKMLSRTCEILKNSQDTTPHIYADESDISDCAADAVNAMYNSGIMRGKGDNEFKPQDTLTKEELIVTILRISQM